MPEVEFPLDLQTITVEADLLEVRDAAKREVDARIMPWDTWIETVHGPEKFARGAFDGIEPSDVYWMGPDHEATIGIGQDGKPVMRRRVDGVAIALESRADGAYATFKVARTRGGDDSLGLITDGVYRGVSVEIAHGGEERAEVINGRKGRVHTKALLTGVSPTYKPAYVGAQVVAVRSAEGVPVAETPAVEATVPAVPEVDTAPIVAAMTTGFDRMLEGLKPQQAELLTRMAALEEAGRAAFQIPNGETEARGGFEEFKQGDWMNLVLRMFSGERIPQKEIETRVAADLITSENIGVVPPAYLDRMIGIIDRSRPFLESTTKIDTPSSGMSLILPRIVTRPTTGIQAAEKDELTSTDSAIDTVTISVTTIGGYGDLSIQLLRRSSPSFLNLYLDLLAEAYAIDADDKAVDVLLADSTVHSGGALAPENISLGPAWRNGVAVSRRLTPDHIWLSTDAVVAFIDAKTEDGRAPLYTSIQAGFDVPGGPGGRIMGLIPVHVPALDDESVDIIVGPSRGFVWAEDGTFTLQVDVPSKAGRDVALVGMIWPASIYGAAFTKYTLGGS